MSSPLLLCLCLFFYILLTAQQMYSGCLYVSPPSSPDLLLLLLPCPFLHFYPLLSALQVNPDFILVSHTSSSPALLILCPFLFFYVLLSALQVYSGAASETAFIGKESPGPQAYDQHGSGMGRQVSLILCLSTLPLDGALPFDFPIEGCTAF